MLTEILVYENIGNKYKLEWPTTILGCLAFCITIPIYIFYWKGPEIRKRSKFAQTLATERNHSIAVRNGSIPIATLAGGVDLDSERHGAVSS